MSNVVQLRMPVAPVAPQKGYSEAFEAAWKAYPDLGRIRSSRKEAWKAWQRVAREIGEDALVGAVHRYIREDKEHRKECGPPGFHRWLNWGRYEHWTGQPETAASTVRRFPHEALRRDVVAAKGEAFAVSYLDPCEVDGTILIIRTGVAADKLKELGALFLAAGFTGMRRRQSPVGEADQMENAALSHRQITL